VDPEQVLVTMGSSPAFLYLFAALVEAGDEILVGTPHYSCYPNFIRFFGGTMVEVPTDAADGYRLDPERVRERITPRTRAVLINSPSNPAGAVLDPERMRAIAELGLPVISDEIYHGLVYEGEAHSILEYTPRAYVLDGFSKRYAMTGWRLGYLVAPRGELRAFQKMQQNFLISANSFVQRAGIVALEKGDAAVERMRAVYDRRRKVLVELMREAGFGIPVMPQGAFYVFADASKFIPPDGDSLRFAFELLENAGVGVAPGVDFGQAGKRAVRFSYASSEENIREAARRLGECLGRRV
jgi:aspartate/methionine/tyrosine aminotransferase